MPQPGLGATRPWALVPMQTHLYLHFPDVWKLEWDKFNKCPLLLQKMDSNLLPALRHPVTLDKTSSPGQRTP